LVVVAVGALLVGAVGWLGGRTSQLSGLLTPVRSLFHLAGAVAPVDTSTTDPAQQAIQQVIQRGDEEQAQAIATRDTSVMADTSTSDYYQQMVQNNQELLDHGVTAIKLVKIEWGPITVNGATATAADTETWSTNYADGTTRQSRDRNVYTLVSEGGTWKVRADDHPDDNQTPTTSRPPSAGP